MDGAYEFLLFPAAAVVVFVGMHTWLGLQILRRDVIFADLALAQLSAFGTMVAVAMGHPPAGPASLAYALLFAMFGALFLTMLRRLSRGVSQEAIIGVVYVVATALTILVVDASPQGAEHVKKIFVGSILAIGSEELAQLAMLYAIIGCIHCIFRRQLLAAANPAPGDWRLMRWDLLFYSSFAVVVTSSVTYAGVLLVFSFLIIPAVIGGMFSHRILVALGVGWISGIFAGFSGFYISLAYDLPTGATLVALFGLVLVAAFILHHFIRRPARGVPKPDAFSGLRLPVIASAIVLVQGVWYLAVPTADQPLAAALEAANITSPTQFLTATEQRLFNEASRNDRHYRAEVELLREAERSARWKGEALTEEEVQKLSAFQRSYNEMAQGERFVQEHLRKKSRTLSRWYFGVPAIGLALTALGMSALIYINRIRRKR
jgi:zinc/manganese transport system permease protein